MALPIALSKTKETKVEGKEAEEPAVGPIVPKVKDELSPAHLLQLEVLSREVEISRLQRFIKEQEIKLKMQEQRLVAFELADLQRQMMQAIATNAGKSKVRTDLINGIKEIYGISDNFGYNPETGVVVRD